MSAPLVGQVTLTGTATVLSATPVNAEAFVIKAPQTNQATAYIGPAGVTSSNGYPLDPGETFTYERNSQEGKPKYELRVSDLYAVGTGPDSIGWFASP